MKRSIILSLCALLAACGSSADAPGGVSAGEKKALDDAAEMVEGKNLNPAVMPSVPAASTAPAPAKTN